MYASKFFFFLFSFGRATGRNSDAWTTISRGVLFERWQQRQPVAVMAEAEAVTIEAEAGRWYADVD